MLCYESIEERWDSPSKTSTSPFDMLITIGNQNKDRKIDSRKSQPSIHRQIVLCIPNQWKIISYYWFHASIFSLSFSLIHLIGRWLLYSSIKIWNHAWGWRSIIYMRDHSSCSSSSWNGNHLCILFAHNLFHREIWSQKTYWLVVMDISNWLILDFLDISTTEVFSSQSLLYH